MRELRSKSFIAAAVAGPALIVALPQIVEVYTIFNLSVYAILATLALSLGLVWGMGGILSFGQSAFFGLGGYAYAIAAINFAGSTPGLLAAVALPVVAAAVIGYFAFFGRISDVYFAVISLTVSLILYNLINSTSGAAYRIGDAPLGGYNGIPSVPPLNLPFAAAPLDFAGTFYAAALLLLVVYLGLRLLVNTRFGRVVVSVRENELRAELLGYDVRLYKLGVFCLGAAIAGLAGAFYAAWGSFIGPGVFSIGFAAQIIVWVLLGGLGTLIGPVLGCFIVQSLTAWLGEAEASNPSIVLGVLFLAAVMLVPKGLVPSLREWGRRLLGAGRAVPRERAP
ncbi:MAG TPA: branched-chain amino acid ABC transporter permease [Burkholderiales bacterium]